METTLILRNGQVTTVNASGVAIEALREKEIAKLAEKIEKIKQLTVQDYFDTVGDKLAAKLYKKIKNDENFVLADEYEIEELQNLRGESFSNWIENVKGFEHSLVGSANNLRASAEKIRQTVLDILPDADIDTQRAQVVKSFGKMSELKEAVLEWIFPEEAE